MHYKKQKINNNKVVMNSRRMDRRYNYSNSDKRQVGMFDKEH